VFCIYAFVFVSLFFSISYDSFLFRLIFILLGIFVCVFQLLVITLNMSMLCCFRSSVASYFPLPHPPSMPSSADLCCYLTVHLPLTIIILLRPHILECRISRLLRFMICSLAVFLLFFHSLRWLFSFICFVVVVRYCLFVFFWFVFFLVFFVCFVLTHV